LSRAPPESRIGEREFRRLRSIITSGLLIARCRFAARRAVAATFARTFPIVTT
jgi:hypothetical protein